MRRSRILAAKVVRRSRFGVWAAFWVCVGCAVERPPVGGKKDLSGPVLIAVDPPHGRCNVRPRRVVFVFDKYLEAGDFSKAVFVSPVPEKTPEFYTRGKRLYVRWRAPLRDSTTYVFTLGSALRDYHEKRPLSPPLNYAFSTGSALDTCTVRGRVDDAFSAKPVADAVVMLFAADSVADGNYVRRRPQYAAATDSTGAFALRFLRPGRYRIFGVVEKDRNFRYNAPNETVATAFDDLVELRDSACARFVRLKAFLPDTFAPRLVAVRPLNERNWLLRFNEPTTDVRIRIGDTVRQNARSALPPDTNFIRLYAVETDEPKTVRLPGSIFGVGDTFGFRLWAADTAGMWMDTVATLTFKAESVRPALRWAEVAPPDTAPFSVAVVFDSPVSPPFRGFYWRDSSGFRVQARVVRGLSPYRLLIEPPSDSAFAYAWLMDTSVVSDDGYRLDSVVEKKYVRASSENRASISGVVSPPTVVLFLVSGAKTRVVRPRSDGTFAFAYLAAGEYSLYALHDDDGNGRWTTGSVTPRRPPENVVFFPEKLKVREGWTIEKLQFDARRR
ncbi:MAG: carboxypeptidase regulatory-like domain-containing protein [Bacteroidia bacterium]|nr:carboxypeptidase regulatory-like domain-containing protein [Bacteroidia bacterium]